MSPKTANLQRVNNIIVCILRAHNKQVTLGPSLNEIFSLFEPLAKRFAPFKRPWRKMASRPGCAGCLMTDTNHHAHLFSTAKKKHLRLLHAGGRNFKDIPFLFSSPHFPFPSWLLWPPSVSCLPCEACLSSTELSFSAEVGNPKPLITFYSYKGQLKTKQVHGISHKKALLDHIPNYYYLIIIIYHQEEALTETCSTIIHRLPFYWLAFGVPSGCAHWSEEPLMRRPPF